MVQRLQYSLVITNISKRNNVTKLIEAGLAFGCRYILIVGQPKNFDHERFQVLCDNDDETMKKNDDDTTTTTVIRRFGKWKECQDFLDAQSMSLVGVEIHPDAVTVEAFVARIIMQQQQQPQQQRQQQHPPQQPQQPGTSAETLSSSTPVTPQPPLQHHADHPRFPEPNQQEESPPPPLPQYPHVALIMGNEGTGLSDKLMEQCQRHFVRIPQYGRGTASLNVYVAASIVLSQFYYYLNGGQNDNDEHSAGKEKRKEEG